MYYFRVLRLKEALVRQKVARFGVLVVLAAAVVAGCGSDDDTAEPPPPPTTEVSPPPPPPPPDPELTEDVQTAVRVTDEFWARHWSEFFTGSYTSPEVFGAYVGNDNPSCGGGQPPGAGNAYYCPAEDYLAWDQELLESQFRDEETGDAFVYFLIAHEWGHAIQARLDQSIVSVAAELQADCFAAATLVGAINDGELVFEAGDRGEIFQSLTNLADEFEWGDPAAHGSADQRVEAYQRGEGGVSACLETG
jgi:uncharacterized protein